MFQFVIGGYGIRNKEKTRKFLKMWADLELHKPIEFHSSDNGAIHMALMIWFFGMNNVNAERCILLYVKLEDPVTNLKPYWNFVNCARRTLGMGNWEGVVDEKNGPKDPALKKFRELGLKLQNNGILMKIYPRFKAILI